MRWVKTWSTWSPGEPIKMWDSVSRFWTRGRGIKMLPSHTSMPLLTHTVTLFSVYHLLLAISNIVRCNSLILFKLYGWLISVHLSYSEIRLPVALSHVSFCRASWHLVVILWHCTKIIKLFALTTLNFYFRLSNPCLSAWNKILRISQPNKPQKLPNVLNVLSSHMYIWSTAETLHQHNVTDFCF